MADSMADSMADGFETEAKELQLVHRVALSSLGPGGSLQGVQANASTGVGVLSSASRRLFESLRLRTWHARALVRLAVQPQAEAFGDGGLVAAALASALVQAVRSGSESALDRFRMVRCLEGALDSLRRRMNRDLAVDLGGVGPVRPVRDLDWSDMGSLVALVRAVVAPKAKIGATDQEVDHICRTLVRAFVLAVPHSTLRRPEVSLVTVVGPPAMESYSTSSVVADIPVCREAERMLPLSGPSVVVFNTSLDVDLGRNDGCAGPSQEFGVTVEARSGLQGSGEAAMGFELRLLSRMVAALASENVAAVACQKTIHPFVKQELALRGIVPIERVSLRHIDAVASCCGVDPVSVISEGALRSIRSHVGKLEGIHLRRLCRKTVVSFEPLADAKTQTVVLTAPNEIAMGELAHSCRSAVAVLTSALQSPYVTPGAGFFEMVLSSTVRSQLPSPTDKGRRLERSVLESLAGTLETIAGKLGGGDSGDREASLRRSWEFATRRGLLDLVMSKLAAVEYAVDAACNLSQVDCTLVCQ